MSKKDYEALAAAINQMKARWHTSLDGNGAVCDTAVAIANALADDNPRFDRARFLSACGVNQ